MISVFDRVEKIVGKGASADYHYFLLLPQYFQKLFLLGPLNPLPDGKILGLSNLKQIADNIFLHCVVTS